MATNAEIQERIEGESPNSAGYYHIHCPDCQTARERKPKMYVSTHSGWWKCWRCGVTGRLPGDWEEVDDDGWEDVPEERPPIEEPSEYHALPGTHRLLEPARAYLRGRGVPDHVVAEARLGYARKGDHAQRVIMPIPGPDGEWLGWVGAAIRRPHPVPYWTAGNMDRESTFYNDCALARVTEEPLLVTEGPFDALRHWPNAVACLGKPTPSQIKRLRRAQRPLIIALDGDSWREGVGVAESLRVDGRRAYAVVLPRGQDLDDTDPELVRAAVAMAVEHATDIDTRTD